MAEQEQAPSAPAYDPNKTYVVTWARRVTLGGVRLPLVGSHDVTGEALNRIVDENGSDAIASAVAR